MAVLRRRGWAQNHAESVSSLASRAMLPPRHRPGRRNGDGPDCPGPRRDASRGKFIFGSGIIRRSAFSALDGMRPFSVGSASIFSQNSSGIFQPFDRGFAKGGVMLGQHERHAAAFEAPAIAFENRFRSLLRRDVQMIGGDGQMSAGGQANQVDRVGQPADFVEIVDAPDQPAFDVAPGAEVFDVQIADRRAASGALPDSAASSGQVCAQR